MFKIFKDIDFILEETLLFVKKHIVILVAIVAIVFISIFVVTYFISKNYEKKQNILSKYFIAQNFIYQKNNAQALKELQFVYANSSGILEAMAFSSIVDLLLEDKQYDAILVLISDISTLKQKPDIALMFVAKAVTLLNNQNFSYEKTKDIKKNLYNFLKKLDVSKEFVTHKNILLVALGDEKIKIDLKTLPQNKLTDIFKTINE